MSLLPTPPVEVDDETRARVRAATYERIRQHEAGRRRRARITRVAGPLSLLVAVSAGAAMIVMGVASLGQSPAPSYATHDAVDPSTEAVFAHVSLAAEKGAREAVPTTVAPGDYVYVRSYVIPNEGSLGGEPRLGKPHERQVWFSQAPGDDRDDVIREFGQDWPINYSGGTVVAGPSRPTYAWLATLPTTPDQLLARLRELSEEMGQDGSDATVFNWIGDLTSETLMPPRTAAALWQAAKLIPGVSVVPDATDALGRHGLGITMTGEPMIRSVWVFDATSYTFLGGRQYLKAPSVPGGELLFDASAIQQRAVVPERGAVPGDDSQHAS